MSRPLVARTAGLLAFLALLAVSAPARAAVAPPPDRALESGWATEGYVDPGYEAERAQIAFDGAGQAISVWSGRASVGDPLQMRWSRLTGTAWSASTPMFAATTANERLPQLSRAPDGTVWVAWLRDNNSIGSGGGFRGPALLAARLAGGAWSAPETVAVEVPLLDDTAPEVDFSILAVSQDQAWLTWGIAPDGDPFSTDRDLVYAVRSAAGWSASQPLSSNGLAESHPVLVATTDGSPAAFFTFRNAPSLMQSVHWTGNGWSDPPDDLTATAFYGFDAAPDTNGAVRLVAIMRESPDGVLLEDHIRELSWNSSGFHPGPLINSAPVVQGAGNDPPDWSSAAIASGHECPLCVGPANDLVFRMFWIDFSQTGAPRLYSTLRNAAGFQPYELVGTSYERSLAFPNAVHDPVIDRWYAAWTAPPSFGARLRAKFSYTQDFAGDLGIGATYVSPDTVRITMVCTGDASGRVVRLYRLNWAPGLGSPPFAPPIPADAVPLPGNPFTGPCPLVVDDFPGPGRWFYYAELEAQGTFPARYARSFNAAIVPQSGGGGGGATTTQLLNPRPQPAVGFASLPFDLAGPGSVTLVIRDLGGRLVKTYNLGSLAADDYEFAKAPTWQGQRNDGSAAPPGIYFLTLLVDGRQIGSAVRIVFFYPGGTTAP